MKTLYLIRHAKSSWSDEHAADIDRPLNRRGKRDAPLMGRFLAAKGAQPDRVLCSPAKRTRKTLAPIRQALNLSDSIIDIRSDIYGSNWLNLLDLLQELNDEWNTVFLIGHNPGITDLVVALTAAAVDNLPTCAVAVLDLQIDRWTAAKPRCAALRELYLPKQLFGDAT
ncbi:MAG TPA: histidine phosphatase family protein [bacterium]|jgi:phosphohistidine phosphatase|nr:histidine phosphatase family protein [bacterium]HNT64155.1 histidine phosphatase family protein [bacterium]HOX87477.1 histidine phosphatase family protein [bacterium]HPG47192.1 histidine phosphatase family protein [bacterium]HPM99468.1 histidine phosphatase family protein [bacterium]